MNKKVLIIFTSLYALLCSSHLFWGLDLGNPQHVITKALPIAALVIASLVWRPGKTKLTLALLFSLAGDVASELHLGGELPDLLMIAFFAVAQLFYILEFASHISFKRREKAMSILPGLTAVYALLLVGMAASASIQKREHKICYVLGAVLFLISDGMILLSMLGASFSCLGFLIMLTYYAAQYLLNIPTLTHSRKTSGIGSRS